MKSFGLLTTIKENGILRVKYFDMELANRVKRFVHEHTTEYTFKEYYDRKARRNTVKIEAYLSIADIKRVMAIKQRRVAEVAMEKARQLEIF